MNKTAKFPKEGLQPRQAYAEVRGEIELDANPHQNLAVFATTQMDPEAVQLILDSLAINFPNATQYPHVQRINQRAAAMLADVWNIPSGTTPWGTSTVGSSEAIILAAVAAKARFLESAGQSSDSAISTPNIVLGSNAHTAWFKAANYLGLELRGIPIRSGRYSIDADDLKDFVDKNTVLVVAIAGSHQTGFDDDLEGINAHLERLKHEVGIDVPLHIDAALSGFIYPFTRPSFAWDFRLSHVVSINASGHKYGLVFSSVGWLVFREKHFVPDSVIYHIKYLSGDFEQFSLTFSRGSSHMLAQYYNFLRYGVAGYAEIGQRTLDKARYLADGLDRIGSVDFVYRAEHIPIVVLRLKPGLPYTLDQVAEKVQRHGWYLSVSHLAYDESSNKVMKIVVRDALTQVMLDDLIDRFSQGILELSKDL